MAKKEAIDLLLENTIALQKTLASLATDLKSLNKKVSDLFELFESASSAFKEGKTGKGERVPSDIAGKMDMLVEQNKTLAKGLILLDKTLRGKESTEPSPMMPSSLSRTRATKSLKKKPLPEEEEEEIKVETSDEGYQSQPLPEFSF